MFNNKGICIIFQKIKYFKNNEAVKLLGEKFRSPGHVPICISSKKLLNERFGHTELTIALLSMSNLIPVGAGCEIMGDNGKALAKEEAIKYANRNNLIYLEGEEIIKAWNKWLK